MEKRFFLDRFDYWVFKRLDVHHIPVTTLALIYSFFGGIIAAIIVYTAQLFGATSDTQEVVAGIICCGVFVFVLAKLWQAIRNLDKWWKSLVYALYLLVISFPAFMLGIWVLTIAIVILVLYFIFKIFFSGKSTRSKHPDAEVHYSDGTVKKAKYDGTGILGEKYYKDEDGNEYIR